MSCIWPTVSLTSHKKMGSYLQPVVPVTVHKCRMSLWPEMLMISHSASQVGMLTHSIPLVGMLINSTHQVDMLTHSMSVRATLRGGHSDNKMLKDR